MNTSRVPGLSRNSGWQAVTSEIVEARAVRQLQSELITAEAGLRAADATWQLRRSA